MRKILVILVSVISLSSCAPTRLYYWGEMNKGATKYEQLAYNHYNSQTPESICELVALYEDMVNNPGGIRNVVPPGIYAEYGFLLLQVQTIESFEKHATRRQRKLFNTDNYTTLFHEKGIEMLEKEMELYPESRAFISPILNRVTNE